MLCVFICLLRSNSGHWSTPTDVQCPCLLICVRMQWERQKFVTMLPCVKIWVNVHNSSTRTYYDTSISVYRHLCNHASAHLFLFDILMCDFDSITLPSAVDSSRSKDCVVSVMSLMAAAGGIRQIWKLQVFAYFYYRGLSVKKWNFIWECDPWYEF